MNIQLSEKLATMASQARGDTHNTQQAYLSWIWYRLFSGIDAQTCQQELANIEADANKVYTAQQLLELSWKATVLEKLIQQHRTN